jgi:hypothetical protein
MCNTFGHLVENGIRHFVRDFPEFADAILHDLVRGGCEHLADSSLRVVGFIDNTIIGSNAPGGGPTVDGEDAPRNDPLIQRAFYQGWKKLHGIKLQFVVVPNGMIADMYGPVSCRHHDLWVLAKSHLGARIVDEQRDQIQSEGYCVYGDSAYWPAPGILRRHEYVHRDLTAREVLENRAMASARVEIEHVNKDLKTLFAFIDYKKDLKLRECAYIREMLVTAVLFTNCITCLNGCQSGRRFKMLPPELEEYLALH